MGIHTEEVFSFTSIDPLAAFLLVRRPLRHLLAPGSDALSALVRDLPDDECDGGEQHADDYDVFQGCQKLAEGTDKKGIRHEPQKDPWRLRHTWRGASAPSRDTVAWDESYTD